MHRSIHPGLLARAARSSIRLSATFAGISLLAAGCSGGSKSKDHGAPSTTYPAPHTAMPSVHRNGGGVMTSPKFVAVTYEDDANRATWEDFSSKMGPSGYWTAATSEYGIGAGVALPPVHRGINSPQSLAESDIDADVAAQVNGGTFTASDLANTLFLLYYPETVSISGPTGTACLDYGAYHTYVSTNAGYAAYAVIPTCTGGQGGVIATTTGSASHEAVEAATDPFGGGYYGASGSQNGVWDLASFGTELGDYCEYQPDAFPVADFGYTAQSTWSNAAAAAGHNPCEPWAGPFFAAAPVLKDTLSISLGNFSLQTQGVKMAVGSTKTIQLDYFSDAATTGTYTVSFMDIAKLYGYPSEAIGTVDLPQGVNGQKAYLTISRNKNGTLEQQFFGANGTLGFISAKKDQNHWFLWPIWISQ